MKYLKIENNGELDIRLVALMGGTTKSNNVYKIGQFGTGLKYTLAWLFRNNLDVHIYSGAKKVDVRTETEIIRDEPFEIICINGQRTSITTGMGREWEAWMIIRELWCNALDEEGATKEIVDTIEEGKEGTTVFYIQINSDVQEVLDTWDKYFIADTETPIFTNSFCKLYPTNDHLCIYKNGVLVKENISVKAVFKYDILDAVINELREYTMSPSYDISRAIKDMDMDTIRYFIDRVTPEHYEGNNMDYNWYTEWGQYWKALVSTTQLMTESLSKRYSSYGYDYDETRHTKLPECIYNSLVEKVGDMEEQYKESNQYQFYMVENAEVETKVQLAISRLNKARYSISPKIKWTYGFFDKDRTQYRIAADKKVMLSTELAKLSAERLIEVIVEINETVKDEERKQLKDLFVTLYTNKIMTPVIEQESAEKAPVNTDSYWVTFLLTMPGVGSWDGKWTSNDKLHAVTRSCTNDQVKYILGKNEVNNWQYSFGDGWIANVQALVIPDEERAELLKDNVGFCGYDWMINSILKYNEILSSDQQATIESKAVKILE